MTARLNFKYLKVNNIVYTSTKKRNLFSSTYHSNRIYQLQTLFTFQNIKFLIFNIETTFKIK